MKTITPSAHFISFKNDIGSYLLPDAFSMMEGGIPHPLCVLATEELQDYLVHQTDFEHNFGLSANAKGMIIGKMFGVLVVQNNAGKIGYLAGFSGKLAGGNQHKKFVPPVFDTLSEDGFLNKGMEELASFTKQIKVLEEDKPHNFQDSIKALKAIRKSQSISLQNRIFEGYHFLNQFGAKKSLIDLFNKAGYKNPPAGAGECAGPKLLQYAYQNQLKPLAIAEFWWGQSPKSNHWKHREFYPSCKEKCEPILAHMLGNS